ncbi:MAG: hypothetical protein L3K09_00255 [Thermoplasmata archaeon]|nr:hypothetical protein [Thermoplasmata archaeon]
MAATESQVASAGFVVPHRLALVQLSDGVRAVAVVDGPLPPVKCQVELTRDGAVYRCRVIEASGSLGASSIAP